MPKIDSGLPGSAVTEPTARPPTVAAGGRDHAIDVLRGVCIISMTTAHLSQGSWLWQIFHLGIFIDGAVGFVLLSGLVVGMTQRRIIDRDGLPAGQRKLLRRSVVIYAAHLCLCAVAFAITTVDAARAATNPGVDALGGPLPAAVATLTLRYSPHLTSILSLYVVLLLLATLAVAGLKGRRAGLVMAGSMLLYVGGYCWPAVFTFSVQPGVPGPVNWGTWQLLFMAALVVGWHWDNSRVHWAVTSRRLWWAAAGVVLAFALLGWQIMHGTRTPLTTPVLRAFTEGTLAPGTILMAFAAVLVGYRVCRVLVRVAGRAVAPLGVIGRRSLDCYLILSVMVIVLPSLSRYPAGSLASVAIAAIAVTLMLLWCLLRDRLDRTGPPRPRAVSGPA